MKMRWTQRRKDQETKRTRALPLNKNIEDDGKSIPKSENENVSKQCVRMGSYTSEWCSTMAQRSIREYDIHEEIGYKDEDEEEDEEKKGSRGRQQKSMTS